MVPQNSRGLKGMVCRGKMGEMSTLQEIEAAVHRLDAAELAELERFVREERHKTQVPWPDFEARRKRIFPNGPPPGKPLSKIVDEGRGEY